MVNPIPTDIRPAGHQYKVPDLLFVSNERDEDWIVENLIRPGDQVLLAGAPKSGKSLIGLQLALFVALGGMPKQATRRFMFAQAPELVAVPEPGKPPVKIIAVKKPRKVLYFSFEMGPKSVSSRLRKQLAGLGFQLPDETQAGDSALNDVPLDHVFELPPRVGDPQGEPRRSLQLVVYAGRRNNNSDEEATFVRHPNDFDDLREIIRVAKPDLVVFDTLIQLHQLNENANIEMKAVMQGLRGACVRPSETNPGIEERVAHVVLHHLRKEGPQSSGQPGAEGMRGAGSIHSEADLALTIKQWGPKWILQTSARDVSVDDLVLWRDDESLLFWSELKSVDRDRFPNFVATIIHRLLSDEKLMAAHPDGVSKVEAFGWFGRNATTIAKEKQWKDAPVWTSKRVEGLLVRLTEHNLLERTVGGGKGKQTRFKRLSEGPPEFPHILAALDGIVHHKKHRAKAHHT